MSLLSGWAAQHGIPDDATLAARFLEARGRVAAAAHRTPVVTSRTLDARLGARVFFKCENFQRMGAFKFRGAFNLISQLPPEALRRGVVAYSSGNHAQAVALVARELGAPAVIVMPSHAPAAKLAGTRGYGAEVMHYDLLGEGREALAGRIAEERGMTLVPPFDHPDILLGQGTAAAELIEDAGSLDLLLTPLGGGGLLSGSAVAARILAPSCRVVGVEPAAGDDGARSFRSGRLETVDAPDTLCDGARTPSLSSLTLGLIRRNVGEVVTCTDDEVLVAMRWLWERLKLVVEPTGALGLAALLAGRVDGRGRRIGVVLSGGNVDLGALAARLAATPNL
ncbi:MAG: threo-3-hydroxy-L-aspartate ammonia-lyase [Candidatus Eisenbacteria bacterium]|nr:threo-3-hydroxy-L-aspartate ammonia-lyase [Candidatus Eisenbacteria bacterium]